MSLPLNFKQLLNLYNIDLDDTFKFVYSLEENVSVFTQVADANNNGRVDYNEYRDLLEYVKMPAAHVDNIFNSYDLNNDSSLSSEEFLSALTSFDANDNNRLDFGEAINFLNQTTGSNVDQNTSFSQYSTMYSGGKSFIESLDLNADGVISTEEYGDALESMNLQRDKAAELVSVYDLNQDGNIDLSEYMEKGFIWDTNKDGIVTYEEAVDLHSHTPGTSVEPPTELEMFANGLLASNDADQDGLLSVNEYKSFLGEAIGLPASMAEKAIELYGGDDNKLSYDEILNAYKSFDENNDDSLSFEESLNFQNALTKVQIDPNSTNMQQYMGLFSTAQGMLKAIDGDFDGEISVQDYRASIRQQEEFMKQIDPTAVTGNRDYMAENFIRQFDMDKNGTVNIIELVNSYITVDSNADGRVSGGEFSDMQAKLENSTLWDNVNAEFISQGDKNSDSALSVNEYKDYLQAQGLPDYVAQNAFAMFDLNADNKLSRLELMEMYSRYDGNVVHTEYIEANNPNIATYELYAGNQNNALDIDEKLQMWTDLSAVDFAATQENLKQYNILIPSLQEFVQDKDFNIDGYLSLEDFKAYTKEQNLPDYLAEAVISTFDLKNDNNIDLFEWIKVNLEFDQDKSGALETEEALVLYSQLSGVELSINDLNKNQHNDLYASSSDMVTELDYNEDNILQYNELKKHFKQDTMPADLAQKTIELYDVNGDGGLDSIEWLKASVDMDKNADGAIDFQEELGLYDAVNGTGLNPDETNVEQYSIIYDEVKQFVKQFDVDASKTLNREELKNHFTQKGLPEYMVDGAMSLYDLNSDNSVDLLEWMKATVDFDADLNGKLEFHEELLMYDNFAGVGLGVNSENSDQYKSFKDQIFNMVQKLDFNENEILSGTEFANKIKELGLPEYLADNAISIYDVNGDGGVDMLEWLNANVDYDKNQNGQLEFDEELEMNSAFSGANIEVDPANAIQYEKIYNNLNNFFNQKDVVSDRLLDADELGAYFTDSQLPESLAVKAIELYDIDQNNALDIYEWMKPHISYDVNKNGILDYNEKMAMNAEISGIAINVDETNAKQIINLHNYAKKMLLQLDQNADSVFDAEEYQVYFKNLGLPDYLADNAVAKYDFDGDNALNAMEFIKATLDQDTNKNGIVEFDETLNYYAEITNIPLSVSEDNLIQHQYAYNYAVGMLNNLDKNADEIFNADEYKVYLKQLGLPAYIAEQAISSNDINGDGGLDALEYMNMALSYDSNANGAFEMQEMLNYYSDTANLGIETNSDNFVANNGTYLNGIKTIAAVDKNNDKQMSAEEYKVYLKQLGLPEYMVDNAIVQYDLNGDNSIDALEYWKMGVELDANDSGKMEFNELLNYYSNISGVALGSNTQNETQHSALYNNGIKMVAAMDTNNNKKIDATEYAVYLNKLGMPEHLAAQAINMYDVNNDNELDAIEYMKMTVDLDSNNSGIQEFNEQMDFYSNISGIDFNTDTANMNQQLYLFKHANGMVGAIDKDLDKKFDVDEYRLYLKNQGLPEHIADNAIAQYDLNNDGNIDMLEYTKLALEMDKNATGVLEFEELMSYYSSISGIDFGTTEANAVQHKGLYGAGIGYVKTLDTNKDGKFDAAEYKVYLQNQGLPAYLADEAIARYDLNFDGGVDSLEWMKMYVDLDSNNSGKQDFNELINYYSSISNIEFNPTTETLNQHINAYNSGKGTVNGYDVDYNKLLSVDELKTYMQKLTPAEVTNAAKAIYNETYTSLVEAGQDAVTAKEAALNAYNDYIEQTAMAKASASMNVLDLNGDGNVDSLEWMKSVLNKDQNNNGLFDLDEITAFYNSL